MSLTREILVRLLLACALSLAALPAHAGKPIEVSTRCDVKEMNDHYAQSIKNIQGRPIKDVHAQSINNILDRLRSNIVQDLQKRSRLSYWSFVSPGATQKRTGPLALEFQVFSPQRNELKLRMTYRSPTVEQSWETIWMNPGKLKTDGYPRFEIAAGEIFKVVLKEFLNPREEELRSLLEKSAPLAVGAHWDDNPNSLRIVLPLLWERYKSLRRSQFRLDCTWSQDADEAEIELISKGDGQPAMYKEKNREGKERQYEALAASPHTWRSYREERQQPIEKLLPKVRQLHPRVAYLHKEEKLTSMQIEVFEEGK